ncbi:MAG: NAD(P)/FAD-dependent oxidoreductase [Pyrinomonadaceae bacterium]|nr:NAD(P)/FAD-dependent oxidoreductase [Phycisphaerales bacterium]
MSTPPAPPIRIVILGGGYAGAYCAQAIERLIKSTPAHPVEVTVIDRHNFFVFYPLLVEAGTGSLEPRHAVMSIRAFLKRSRFLMATVTALDVESKVVTCNVDETDQQQSIQYDHLVLALGSVTRMPEVPGLREFGFEMKSLGDAVALRDRAIEMLESADATVDPAMKKELLHFVVVGGNFTGVEVAGELDALLSKASDGYRHVTTSDILITLVERGPRILSVLGDELSDYAAKNLKKRGVELRLGDSVNAIGEDFAQYASGEKSPARTVIWCAGIAPTPTALRLPIPRDERGYILCERDLRVKGIEGLWAIGDCAVLRAKDGTLYPATAQHAIKEGRHLARNLSLALQGKPPLPCDIQSEGSLAALGCRTGVAQIMGIKLSGFIAWWMWRTVYLMKTPGWGRRLRVALDWSLDLITPRDYVQLGVHRNNRGMK